MARMRESIRMACIISGLALLPLPASAQKLAPTGCLASSQQAGFECAKAKDGSASTLWKSTTEANSQWIYLDFGKTLQVKKILLNWGAKYAQHFQIQYSLTGGGSWQVMPETEWITGQAGLQTVNLGWDNVIYCRYLKMWGDTQAGFELKEMEAFGAGVYTDEQVLTRTLTLGAWDMSQVTPTDHLTLDLPGDIEPKRIISLQVSIYSDPNAQGKKAVIPLERLGHGERHARQSQGGRATVAAYPDGSRKILIGRNADDYFFATGGNLDLSPYSSQIGTLLFTRKTNSDGSAYNRGYVTILYLSVDPE